MDLDAFVNLSNILPPKDMNNHNGNVTYEARHDDQDDYQFAIDQSNTYDLNDRLDDRPLELMDGDQTPSAGEDEYRFNSFESDSQRHINNSVYS